jgi:uncharacterized protein (TIGR02598 family)
MATNRMNQSASHRSAFSLVEITLAIGVAAVALVTIIGLIGVSADSNGAAGRDTVTVTMTTQVMNELRGAASFEALWAKDPRAMGFVPKPNGTTSPIPLETSYFFTEDGRQVVAGATDVIYECTVRKTADLPRPQENKGPSNLLKLQLVFTSPVAANPIPDKRPNRRIVNASIARF